MKKIGFCSKRVELKAILIKKLAKFRREISRLCWCDAEGLTRRLWFNRRRLIGLAFENSAQGPSSRLKFSQFHPIGFADFGIYSISLSRLNGHERVSQ